MAARAARVRSGTLHRRRAARRRHEEFIRARTDAEYDERLPAQLRPQTEIFAAYVAETQAGAGAAYEAVSEALHCPVAGVTGGFGAKNASEVKIEAANGYWTSGWHPLADGFFEIPVVLQEGATCAFVLSVRDAAGRALEVEPRGFRIRHGLSFSAPPLPHTISVEVARGEGGLELHPVFPRMTLLPAEKTVAPSSTRRRRASGSPPAMRRRNETTGPASNAPSAISGNCNPWTSTRPRANARSAPA